RAQERTNAAPSPAPPRPPAVSVQPPHQRHDQGSQREPVVRGGHRRAAVAAVDKPQNLPPTRRVQPVLDEVTEAQRRHLGPRRQPIRAADDRRDPRPEVPDRPPPVEGVRTSVKVERYDDPDEPAGPVVVLLDLAAVYDPTVEVDVAALAAGMADWMCRLESALLRHGSA